MNLLFVGLYKLMNHLLLLPEKYQDTLLKNFSNHESEIKNWNRVHIALGLFPILLSFLLYCLLEGEISVYYFSIDSVLIFSFALVVNNIFNVFAELPKNEGEKVKNIFETLNKLDTKKHLLFWSILIVSLTISIFPIINLNFHYTNTQNSSFLIKEELRYAFSIITLLLLVFSIAVSKRLYLTAENKNYSYDVIYGSSQDLLKDQNKKIF